MPRRNGALRKIYSAKSTQAESLCRTAEGLSEAAGAAPYGKVGHDGWEAEGRSARRWKWWIGRQRDSTALLSAMMSALLLHQLMQFLLYLTQLREAALLRLGEDEATVHCHLEATAAAGDQGQALDVIAVAVKKLLRRPGGSKEVVSRHAVLDLNGQFLGHLSPLSIHRLEGPFAVHVSPEGRALQLPCLLSELVSGSTWFDDVPAGPGMIMMCLSVRCRASGRWTRA